MATLGNSTCVKLENVDRFGFNYDAPYLFVKGTWFPLEFSLSMCDGTHAWTATASEDFVSKTADDMLITGLEFIDRAHSYFSKQHSDITYELNQCGDKNNVEFICNKRLTRELGLRITLNEASIQNVAVEMFQFLMDAHVGLSEDMARGARAYERMMAAKEQSLTRVKNEKLQLEEEIHVLKGDTNGQPKTGEDDRAVTVLEGTQTRGKRKASQTTGSGSRKRHAQAVGPSESSPVLGFLKPPSPGIVPSRDPVPLEEQSPSIRPPLSLLGYKQSKIGEEGVPDSSNYGSWVDSRKLAVDTDVQSTKERPKRNGAAKSKFIAEESLSDEDQALGNRKGFLSLDDLSDMADLPGKSETKVPLIEPAKKSTGKKQRKSGGSKSSKKQAPPSVDPSLDLVDDIVEKGIQLVETLGSPNVLTVEVSSALATPVKQNGKTPKTAKKSSKSSAKAKNSSSRSSKKIAEVELPEASEVEEVSEAPGASEVPNPEQDADERAISVQNSEFHDFDEIRTEMDFSIEQFWALYDDQDGMPRFYGRISKISRNPFDVSVQWLEPHKPSLPGGGLVKSAGLSAACGDFTFGIVCHQDLLAFSHKVKVEKEKKGVINILPAEGEVWALYRHWNKKQTKSLNENEEMKYDYDLVRVQSTISTTEGVKVVPLMKVAGFKSLFRSDEGSDLYLWIPYKQAPARFSHRVPHFIMCGSESPGVPVGALELDPASTPAEYLDS